MAEISRIYTCSLTSCLKRYSMYYHRCERFYVIFESMVIVLCSCVWGEELKFVVNWLICLSFPFFRCQAMASRQRCTCTKYAYFYFVHVHRTKKIIALLVLYMYDNYTSCTYAYSHDKILYGVHVRNIFLCMYNILSWLYMYINEIAIYVLYIVHVHKYC